VFDADVDCRGNEILPEVEGLARWLVDERAKMLFKWFAFYPKSGMKAVAYVISSQAVIGVCVVINRGQKPRCAVKQFENYDRRIGGLEEGCGCPIYLPNTLIIK
jgi:hypothetical protein